MINVSYPLSKLLWICRVIGLSMLFLAVLPSLFGELATGRDIAPSESSTGKGSIWKGPDGAFLPFENSEEVTEFLLTAEVIGMEEISEGVTGPKRVLLEKDGIQMRAIFREVDSSRSIGPGLKGKLRRNFRDYYAFEVAAYELSRMLGLDSVPPAVLRRINRNSGSLQVWIENALTEKKRSSEGLEPPNPLRYSRQIQIMSIFDNLVYNEDRNLGNILFDENWKLWMIDHTRTFRLEVELSEPEAIMSCSEDLWNNLRNLNEADFKERMDQFLRGSQVKALFARKMALIEHIQKRIDEKGEKAVLF